MSWDAMRVSFVSFAAVVSTLMLFGTYVVEYHAGTFEAVVYILLSFVVFLVGAKSRWVAWQESN